jgi:hypothetical protein
MEHARTEDARDEQGHGKDGTTDVHRRWRGRRRDNPIVDVARERWCDNLTAVAGPCTQQARAWLKWDRRHQQEEAPAEKGQPDHGRCGGEAA